MLVIVIIIIIIISHFLSLYLSSSVSIFTANGLFISALELVY